jgi:transcription initiation factor IIE alpha subunit
MRIKKPGGAVMVPKKVVKRIRREMGDEGVKLFQLLCELADENGQICFEGSEDEVKEQLAALYEARFGDGENGSQK